jgi:molybdenum cofactor cytidylyltransferase
VAVVVLAAGASRRLGQPKQLLVWEGQTLVRRAAEAALAVPGASVAVVLGAQAERIEPELAGLSLTILPNPDWAEGLAASVRAGVRFAESVGAGAALFLLVDQPFVTGTLLNQLVDAYRTTGQPLVASAYGGALGVPLLVERQFFPELLQLTGDRGAKLLLPRYPDRVAAVPFPEGHHDLDTPADWARWQR